VNSEISTAITKKARYKILPNSAVDVKTKEIMLKMYEPHINKNRWKEFEREIESVVAEAGPVTAIAEERYKKNGEIKKIIFRFGNGRRTYVLEPWRELECAGDWQKEYPAEYERLAGLLDEARRVRTDAVMYKKAEVELSWLEKAFDGVKKVFDKILKKGVRDCCGAAGGEPVEKNNRVLARK